MNPYFKAFPQQNSQTQMVSNSEFLENNSKKELELSQNSSGEQTEELLLNLFYKFSKTFTSKPGKDTHNRKLQVNLSFEQKHSATKH